MNICRSKLCNRFVSEIDSKRWQVVLAPVQQNAAIKTEMPLDRAGKEHCKRQVTLA